MNRLRVLVVTEDDPLYVIRFFQVFFREYPRETIELCGITIDRPFHESRRKTFKRMLRFYGWTGVAKLLGRYVWARLRSRSIERLAQDFRVPLVPTASVNAPEYLSQVRRIAPDVIVSVAAPEIFRREILNIPRLGCVNIHSGRLPVYRGMMPTFWQMLHGEREITVTAHEMAEALDAGKVLATAEVAVRAQDSLHRLMSVSKEVGARLLLRVLEELRSGTTTATALDMSAARYFRFPSREDVTAFRNRGHRLL